MAPNKKGVCGAVEVAASGPAIEDATHLNLLCEVEHNLDAIRKHRVFKDIMEANPLPIHEGGSQAPFDQASCEKVLQSGGTYTCGINFMWIGHKLRGMAGVPISQRSINMFLQKNRFAENTFPTVLEIAVDNATYKPLEHKGALVRLTPPEESFAFIWYIKKKIAENAPLEELKQLKVCLLSVTARFIVVETAAQRWWHEHNLREDSTTFHEALAQTVYQRFCGISILLDQLASTHGTASAAKLAQTFQEKARDGGGSEKVTETYIKEVILVRESVFSIKTVRAIVQEFDEKFGHASIFNSIYKLGNVKKQAKTPDLIEWVFEGIRDAVEAESPWLTEVPVTLRDFTKAGNKCVPGVFVHKRQFLDYMLTQVDGLYPGPTAAKFREVFRDYKNFRAVRPYPKQPQPDLMFLAEWPTAARMTFSFIADTCFLCVNPNIHPFQNSWRSGRSVTTVLQYSTVEEQWTKITKIAASAKQDEQVMGKIGGENAMTGQRPDSPSPPAQDDDNAGEPSANASENAEEKKRSIYWRKFAEESVRPCISLRPVTSSEEELTELLKTCDVSKVRPVQGQSTIIKFYDEKLAGEAISHPNLRKPPHRGNYFRTCIGAAMTAEERRIAPGELYIVLDHGKASMAAEVKKSFVGFYDQCQNYDILVDEESLVQRKGRRTKKVMKQSERMYMFVSDPAAIPDEKRKYYKGTSKGQSWGFISLTPLSHVWRLSPEQKNLAYAEARRPVGGKVPQDEAIESGGDEEIEDTDKAKDVPFCYHGFPLMFFQELVHVTHARGVIDFTPGDGNFALAVAERKGTVLYFGLCHTELHCQLLRDRLTDCVLEGMQKEDSPLFNQLCAAEMLGTIVDADKKDPPPPKTNRKRKDSVGKGKNNKKNKKKKKSSTESSTPASPSSEESE